MREYVLKKEAGKVTRLNKEDFKPASNYHLCYQICDGDCFKDCRKVFDLEKETIDKYDFITDGYQIYNENGELEEFVVTECSNCIERKLIKKRKVKRTSEKKEKSIREISKIEENISLSELLKRRQAQICSYYGTDTIEEAMQIKKDLIASSSDNLDDKPKVKLFRSNE